MWGRRFNVWFHVKHSNATSMTLSGPKRDLGSAEGASRNERPADSHLAVVLDAEKVILLFVLAEGPSPPENTASPGPRADQRHKRALANTYGVPLERT